MSSTSTPTALTMRYLRRAGYLVDVCERWVPIPGAKIRRDLFGIGDLVAITPDEPPLLIQATSLANISSRVKKAQGCPGLAVWLKTGARFQVFGWTLLRGRWTPKIVELSGEDMDAMVLSRPPRRGRKTHEMPDLFAAEEERVDA